MTDFLYLFIYFNSWESVPFYIPETWKGYSFWPEPPCKGHHRKDPRTSTPPCWSSLVFTIAHKHKHKHKKNGQVHSSCAYAYAYVVALTSENGVDISTEHKHKAMDQSQATLIQISCEHIKGNMADEASAILFITELRKAQWYQELSQLCHSARAYVLMLILMR